MKAKINTSEICSDGKSTGNGYYQSRVSKLLLTLVLGLFLLSGMNAQTIMSFENAKQSLESSTAEHLQSLATNIYPSVYLDKGALKTYGEGSPVVAFSDAESVNMLYGNDPALTQIELIKIKVNSEGDLPSSIDLTQLQELSNLKYILVVFAYEACSGNSDACLASKLEGMIQGPSTQITVLYELSIPR